LGTLSKRGKWHTLHGKPLTAVYSAFPKEVVILLLNGPVDSGKTEESQRHEGPYVRLVIAGIWRNGTG